MIGSKNRVRKRTEKKVNCFSLGKFLSVTVQPLPSGWRLRKEEVGTRIPGLFLFAPGWPLGKRPSHCLSGPTPVATCQGECAGAEPNQPEWRTREAGYDHSTIQTICHPPPERPVSGAGPNQPGAGWWTDPYGWLQ